jgi:predicted anti-sigma-YlaC factor YlaD
MKNNPCLTIQEEIAWGRMLNPEAQAHVLNCSACRQLTLEFSKLDSVFAAGETIAVPDDFAARVMNKIKKETAPSAGRLFLSAIGTRIGSFFQLKPVQVTLALWIAFSMSRAF